MSQRFVEKGNKKHRSNTVRQPRDIPNSSSIMFAYQDQMQNQIGTLWWPGLLEERPVARPRPKLIAAASGQIKRRLSQKTDVQILTIKAY